MRLCNVAALTVEVLPLGRDELLGGGFAHGLGEALARDGVPGGEDAVVNRLAARHVADSGDGERGLGEQTLPSSLLLPVWWEDLRLGPS